jgi:hypothetical protein
MNTLKKLSITTIVALSLGIPGLCSAQSTAPYTEGPVWDVTMVKTKAGMTDDYLRNLAGAYKKTSDEMKKEGIIMDYKIFLGDAASPHDFNLLLMVEYKDMAALDNIRAKIDPIEQKIIGSQAKMHEGSVKRAEIREILGTKLMREITLK